LLSRSTARPFKFTGKIHKVTIRLEDDQALDNAGSLRTAAATD